METKIPSLNSSALGMWSPLFLERLMSFFFYSHTLQRAGLHRVELNATDLKTLDLLTLPGPLTAGELVEQTGLSSGTTSELIDRLEKAGFVQRERDLHDRQRVMIQLMAERGDEIDPLFFSLSQRMAQLLVHYDQHEMAAIGDFIQHMIALLTEETIPS